MGPGLRKHIGLAARNLFLPPPHLPQCKPLQAFPPKASRRGQGVAQRESERAPAHPGKNNLPLPSKQTEEPEPEPLLWGKGQPGTATSLSSRILHPGGVGQARRKAEGRRQKARRPTEVRRGRRSQEAWEGGRTHLAQVEEGAGAQGALGL